MGNASTMTTSRGLQSLSRYLSAGYVYPIYPCQYSAVSSITMSLILLMLYLDLPTEPLSIPQSNLILFHRDSVETTRKTVQFLRRS